MVGAIYALMALGLMVILGILRIINMAEFFKLVVAQVLVRRRV